jgi:hypothetical protein
MKALKDLLSRSMSSSSFCESAAACSAMVFISSCWLS